MDFEHVGFVLWCIELSSDHSTVHSFLTPLPFGSDMADDEVVPSVLSPWASSPLEPAVPSVLAGNRHASAEDQSVPSMKVSPCYRSLP
jgi:hypothetical protein